MHSGSEIKQNTQKGKVPSRGNYCISQLHIWIKVGVTENNNIYIYVCVCVYLPKERTADMGDYHPLRKYPEILLLMCLEWLKCGSSLKNNAISVPNGHYIQSSPVFPPKGFNLKSGVSRQPALQRPFRPQRSEQGIFLLAHCYWSHGGHSVGSKVPPGFGEFLWCHSQAEVSGSWGEIQLGWTETTMQRNWKGR